MAKGGGKMLFGKKAAGGGKSMAGGKKSSFGYGRKMG